MSHKKNLNACQQARFLGSRYAKIVFDAWTPLGDLTALPRPRSWKRGGGLPGREKDRREERRRKGRTGKRRVGKGREERGKGAKEDEQDGERGREGMEREVTNPLSKSRIRR